MGEFDTDSDSDDLEAMFPDSPGPEDVIKIEQKSTKEKSRISLTQPASLSGPTISKKLKPLYVSMLKKEVFIFSATISDDNMRIIPDGMNLIKEMKLDKIDFKTMQKLVDEYLKDLRRVTPFTEYKKPRYVFVNNLLKPILISFIPHGSDLDKKMYFEGTTMSLKASLKCALPIQHAKTYEELELMIKTAAKQFRQKQLE